MSWSDEARCLFCDGKLPLYRKLAQGQFCSKQHQEAYWKEQEKLAVESLHRTHDALQAYKPTVSIESILGPAPVAPVAPVPQFVDIDPPMTGLLPQTARILPIRTSVAAMVAMDPVEYEMAMAAAVPELTFEAAGSVDVEETVEPAAIDAPAEEAALVALPDFEPYEAEPVFWQDFLGDAEPYSAELVLAPIPELAGFATLTSPEPVPSGAVAWQSLEPVAAIDIQDRTAAVSFRNIAFALPCHAAAPQDDALEQLEMEAFPAVDRLLGLPAPASADSAVASHFEAPVAEEFSASKPIFDPAIAVTFQELLPVAVEHLFGLDLAAAPGELRTLPSASTPIEPEFIAPQLGRVMLPLATSDPDMAPLQRLPLPTAPTVAAPSAAVTAFGALAGSPLLPTVPASPVPVQNMAVRAQATKVLPLQVRERMEFRAGSYKARGPVLPLPVERDVELPRLKLRADHGTSPLAMAVLAGRHTHLLAGVKNFWQQAPRDLKILLFAVPLAIGLAFHPSLPKVSVQAPQAGQDTSGVFQRVLSNQVASVKKAIADRAAIGLDENFRQGLDNWMGNSGSTAEWNFDQAGFVQPGRVALYQPSLGLKDYELQFLGAIDKGALSWVVRAADFQNYYVVKLGIVKPGVIPQLGITRYAVIDGKPVDRVDTPVVLNTHTDSLYRVSMEMQGDHYALSIQGQVIDSWTEKRLSHGGVGFFTNRGEQSRIGWVQITHQYDMLGRLFAYLAP